MYTNSEWVYSNPKWWIDSIHHCCADDPSVIGQTPSVELWFSLQKERYDASMRHLRTRRGLDPSVARRTLFFGKCTKKWRLEIPNISQADRSANAMAGFAVRNAEASDDRFVPVFYDRMKRILSRWLPELPAGDVHGRFGPGACAEKYSHPRRFIQLREWYDQCGSEFEYALNGHADVCADVCRLCAVPKDYDKDRLITVEPAYATFVQQRVRRILLESIHTGPLRWSCMDLGYTDGQAIQRRLAVEASRTGSLATLDLSDASDRISWTAVQTVFPEWVVELLAHSRSVSYRAPTDQSPTRMNIFAGMGNATTFVVETLFFSAYIVAMQRCHGLRPFVSTFGDDIIVTSDCATLLIERYGDQPCFKINESKSFLGNDCVRESCGVFAYCGADITVPRIDGYRPSWDGRLGVADLHYRLISSGDEFQHKLAKLIAAVGVLENWPFYVDGYPSVRDDRLEYTALPKLRWYKDYQKWQSLVKVPVARTRSFSCSDAAVDREPDTLAEFNAIDLLLRRRQLDPPADVWYLAHQLGCVETDPIRLRRRRRHGSGVREDLGYDSSPSSVTFPTGKYKWVWCWRNRFRHRSC